MSSPTRHTLRLPLFAAALPTLLLASCASPTRLAQKSQEQLLEGKPAKAYETALKAARKDSENPEVREALQRAGDAVLGLEADRFRALLPHDTLAAADLAVGLGERRYQMATFGVTAAVDPELALLETGARQAASRHFEREADVVLGEGRPKDAYFLLAEAVRFDPANAATEERRRDAHVAATDRVLVLPFVNETRYGLSPDALDFGARSDLHRAVEKQELLFTSLLQPDLAWSAGSAQELRALSRESALRVGERAGATRVVWGRVHGDRLDTHTSIVEETVYRKTTVVDPEGSRVESWEAHSLVVTTHDRWASVLVECEVQDVADRQLVTRGEDERTVGVRTLVALSALRGSAREYVLYPPEWETSNPAACRAREKAWKERYGDLSISRLADYCQRTPGVAVLDPSHRHGDVVSSSRRYELYYGHMPSEETLLSHALSTSWRLVADLLEEADRIE